MIQTRPHFRGGIMSSRNGSVTGCWLLDVGGRLSPPSVPTLHVARREGRNAVYEVTFFGREDDVADAADPCDFPGRRLCARPFLSFLALIGPNSADSPAQKTQDPGASSSFAEALAAVSPFLSTLDPPATDLAPAAESYPDGTYDGLDGTFETGAPLARAWSAHPSYTMSLAKAWSENREGFGSTAGVDKALAEALQAFEGIPKRLVGAVESFRRHLDGAGPNEAARMENAINAGPGRGRETALCTMGRLLAELPGNWIPRTPPEWAGMVASMPAIELATHFAAPSDWATLLDSRGRWQDFAGRVTTASGGRTLVGNDLVSDAGDVAKSFMKQSVIPAIALSGGDAHGWELANWYPASWEILWGGRTACAIARTTHRWHEARAALATLAGEDQGEATWPAGCDKAEVDGVVLTVLTSASELREEGVRGSHCVAGYVGNCLSGKSRIASLSQIDGTWLSTLEIRFGDDGPRVGQHRTRGNANPTPEARRAAETYVRALRDGSVPHDLAALSPVPDTRPARAHTVHADAYTALVRAWNPFLPNQLKGVEAETIARLAAKFHGTPKKWLWQRRDHARR